MLSRVKMGQIYFRWGPGTAGPAGGAYDAPQIP